MTVLLVIFTIAALLLLDWYLVHQRQRRRALAEAADGGLWLHPGHVWVVPHQGRTLSVGPTSFAANFAGAVRSVDLPREGASLRAGDPLWTLVSARGRRLRQPMPVDGEVVAVNRALGKHPKLAKRTSHEEGWVVRIRPRNLRRSLGGLLTGVAAARFVDETLQKVNARLRPTPGAVAQDGTEWAPEFGERLDDLQWEILRAELFPSTERRGDA